MLVEQHAHGSEAWILLVVQDDWPLVPGTENDWEYVIATEDEEMSAYEEEGCTDVLSGPSQWPKISDSDGWYFLHK